MKLQLPYLQKAKVVPRSLKGVCALANHMPMHSHFFRSKGAFQMRFVPAPLIPLILLTTISEAEIKLFFKRGARGTRILVG